MGGLLDMLDKNYFLTSGDRTELGPTVTKIARFIPDVSPEHSTKDVVKSIMYAYAKYIPMRRGIHPERKFKRSAEEIISQGYRDGCCDSSTLFVALCRAKGIPACQVITAKVSAMNDGRFSVGHFFSGFYSSEEDKWYVIDTNKTPQEILNPRFPFHDFNDEGDFFDRDYLVFAVARDYSDYSIRDPETGITYQIDSSRSMREIHRLAYKRYLSAQKQLLDREEQEFK